MSVNALFVLLTAISKTQQVKQSFEICLSIHAEYLSCINGWNSKSSLDKLFSHATCRSHEKIRQTASGGSEVSESIQEKTVGSTGNVEVKADRISHYLVAKA